MVIPRFDINQIVYIYEHGKLTEKIINKIQILITDKKFKVGYQFEEIGTFYGLGFDLYKDECEVFLSPDDFIKRSITI